jgi:hypothetical protein
MKTRHLLAICAAGALFASIGIGGCSSDSGLSSGTGGAKGTGGTTGTGGAAGTGGTHGHGRRARHWRHNVHDNPGCGCQQGFGEDES